MNDRMRQPASDGKWWPSPHQFKDPVATEQAFRQLLTQHYDLLDNVTALREQMAKPHSNLNTAGEKSSGPPPGSGPADTMLLGLRVAPVDAQTLADGATLKFVKKDGNFKFS